MLTVVPSTDGTATPWTGSSTTLAEAFSASTVKLLRRLKALVLITAAYGCSRSRACGSLRGSHWGRQTKAYVLLPWFTAEVVTLFMLALVALLERLFGAALELRQDHELTV